MSNKPFEKMVLMSADSVTGLNIDKASLGPPLTLKEIKEFSKDEEQNVINEGANDDDDDEVFGTVKPVFPTSKATGRGATTRPDAKWLNCQVPYTISNIYSSAERSTISAAFEEFQRETGIRWVPKSESDAHYVHIDQKTGCNSQVGKVQRQGGQLLSLGKMFSSFLFWMRWVTEAFKIK